MPRLPLGELEQARRDPARYRLERLEQVRESRFRVTYVTAIRFAILRYHRDRKRAGAQRHLEDLLARHNLVNPTRVDETMAQLDWYVDEYESRNWPLIRVRISANVPLPSRVPLDLECSGEVFRVDLNPAGGYGAWVLQQTAPNDWRDELRLPLIQRAIASAIFGVPVAEVAVGIVALKDRAVHLDSYSEREINEAETDLDRLLARMGY